LYATGQNVNAFTVPLVGDRIGLRDARGADKAGDLDILAARKGVK
jgi:hypothetical protein